MRHCQTGQGCFRKERMILNHCKEYYNSQVSCSAKFVDIIYLPFPPIHLCLVAGVCASTSEMCFLFYSCTGLYGLKGSNILSV